MIYYGMSNRPGQSADTVKSARKMMLHWTHKALESLESPQLKNAAHHNMNSSVQDWLIYDLHALGLSEQQPIPP